MLEAGHADLKLVAPEDVESQVLVRLLDRLEQAARNAANGDAEAMREVQSLITATRLETMDLMRHQVELSTLYALGKELASILDLSDLLSSILDKAISLVKAERGLLVLSRPEGEGFEVALARGIDKKELEQANGLPLSRQLIARVLETQSPLITIDAQHDHRFDPTASLVGYRIRSVLAAPLLYQQELTGAIYLDTRVNVRRFQDDDLNLLIALANQAAVAIHIARLYDDLRRKNQELAAMLKELRETQDELIRAERLSAIGQMASTIIHDIKGPLTSIRGFADLLGRPDLTPEHRQRFAAMVTRAVDSFVGMTEEILDYAEGRQSIELEAFSLEGFLRELQEFVVVEFGDAIQVELDVEYGDVFLGDRQKLWRAFYNIAKNAAEAMNAVAANNRQKKLTMSCRREGAWLSLSLADTGPGIPAEIRDTLFQPFVTCGKAHGTGLGLSIAQSIVEAHRGKIRLDSEPGQGAVFTIRLPWMDTLPAPNKI